jgi:hypothetical protein
MPDILVRTVRQANDKKRNNDTQKVWLTMVVRGMSGGSNSVVSTHLPQIQCGSEPLLRKGEK